MAAYLTVAACVFIVVAVGMEDWDWLGFTLALLAAAAWPISGALFGLYLLGYAVRRLGQ